MTIGSPHKVLHVAVELAPLVKLGGLGDVLGSLPKSLVRSGKVDARILLPAYPGVLENAEKYGYKFKRTGVSVSAAVNWRAWSASVLEGKVEGVTVYLLEQPELFSDPHVYPNDLNAETMLPFVFLCYAALELPKAVGWTPEIYHVHDWSTAILPLALRWHRYYRSMAEQFDVVLMLHNLAHQGLVDPAIVDGWGFVPEAFSIDGMEFYGRANLLKGAALASDSIIAVSPHYSWDIQTFDGGFGLHGVFSMLRAKLSGILNGIDYDIWSPATDKMLPAHFSSEDQAGKAVCRAKLIERCGWQDDGKPILLFIGRLVMQKGVDIMLRVLETKLGDSCRAVVIGSGAQEYEAWTEHLQRVFPQTFSCLNGFDEEFAHLAYAGSDILIMPSLFEPCGLSQIIAMSYGTVPVVRNTGGLADTVIDFDGSPDGTGFIFSDYSTFELEHAINRAIGAYWDKDRWKVVMTNAMRANFSWDQSTKAYISVYDRLKAGD